MTAGMRPSAINAATAASVLSAMSRPPFRGCKRTYTTLDRRTATWGLVWWPFILAVRLQHRNHLGPPPKRSVQGLVCPASLALAAQVDQPGDQRRHQADSDQQHGRPIVRQAERLRERCR